ncbi:hypothetical protein CXR04_14645 [Streptomyces sp. CMB-StM0423]|nr:hypothetical protein CXR04_14645 [Streptomyces sp. CMB-StM0423]
MAQALDNQWLPPSAAASRQAATAGSGPDDAHLAAASAELRRALVNSGTPVANRAYFLNNPALYENFAAGAGAAADERRAFARLLNDGSLVPLLLGERDPAERKRGVQGPTNAAARRVTVAAARPPRVSRAASGPRPSPSTSGSSAPRPA